MYRWGLGLAYPSIDAAIQKFEGYAPGTLAYKNNNPGNLVYAPWEAAYGCSAGGAGGFAVCPSYAAGQQIQDALVSTYVDQGLSIQDMLAKWSPPTAQGNSQQSYQNYVASVASDTGLDPSLPISSQLGGDSGVLSPSGSVSDSYALSDGSSSSDSTAGLLASSGMDLSSLTEPGGLSLTAWLGIGIGALVLVAVAA